MNRHDIHNCPAPTTMYSIIGDADAVLEYNKFSVFALASSLLVPNAASLFNAALRRERERKKRHERFVKSYYRKRRREFKHVKDERALKRVLGLIGGLFFHPQPPPTPWTGEGFTPVPLPGCGFHPTDYLVHLVRDLGYDVRAAFTSMVGAWMWQGTPDRRRRGVVERESGRMYDSTFIAQPLPYVTAPSRGTTQGFFSRDSVLKALASMRSPHKMRMATFQVVFSRQSPTQVAEEFGVGLGALKKAATRVRERIRRGISESEKSNVYAASEADVSPILCRVRGGSDAEE